ncbi:MAG: hypothetical protein E5W82_10595 [Mesorhizobium sp.]|nr:MAG: hypothetical protein E5W82_10595 [Mesorhizobium sp.]
MSYFFRSTCSYMGCVWFEVRDQTGSYKAELRVALGDYERSILNYDPDGIRKHVENAIGLLTRCVADNAGEIPAATVAAFNAWRLAEHERHMAHLRANPERYGTEFSEPWFQPPLPVSAGRWTRESGWSRVEPMAIAA